jgi:hypothetical protein
MLTADGLRAGAFAVLAIAAANGPARADVLVSIAVILGACDGLFLPSSFAIVPSLVPADEFQAANALLSGGIQLASAPFFVFAAATTAGAILVGLSQGAWCDFGAGPRIALGERDLTHND